MRTTFPIGNGESSNLPKLSPNILGHSDNPVGANVKFPKRLRYRGKGRVLATIYKRPNCYRLYWRTRVDGKPRSRFKDFPNYSEAKRAGDKTIADLAKKSGLPTLSPGQASDALAAFERLHSYYVATGRRISLLTAVCDYCDSASKLDRHSFSEAIDGFLTSERLGIAPWEHLYASHRLAPPKGPTDGSVPCSRFTAPWKPSRT
jgi:hypothetical protein